MLVRSHRYYKYFWEVNLDPESEALIPRNTNFKIPFMQENELITTIKKLDSSKATGIDGISAKILKLSADIIAPYHKY